MAATFTIRRVLMVPALCLGALVAVAPWSAAPASAVGQTYFYVSAATGTFSSGCTTPATACTTIQDAITAAEGATYDGTAATIFVGPGTYDEGDTIAAASLTSLTIVAPPNGAATSVTPPADEPGVTVESGVVTINGLTITGAANTGGTGGGVDNAATLTLVNDSVTANAARNGNGAGVYNTGTLTMTDDTIANDSATDGGTVTEGGALYNAGTATLTNVTVANDTVPSGGVGPGLYNASGTLTLSGDTIAFDGDSDGGVDVVGGSVTVGASVIYDSGCSATSPGVLVDAGNNVFGYTTSSPADGGDSACAVLTAGDNDIVDNSTTSSGIELSSTLAGNGAAPSFPQTLALGPTSQAAHLVPSAACTTSTDERGGPRPGVPGDNCDAGAFELEGARTATTLYAGGEGASATANCTLELTPCATLQSALDAADAIANDSASTVTIDLAAGTYVESDYVAVPSGSTLAVTGDGEAATILDDQGAGCDLTDGGGTLSVSDLAVTGGNGLLGDTGGGICATGGTLVLEAVSVNDTSGPASTGGLSTTGGTVTVDSSIVISNAPLGISATSGTTLTVTNSTITDNSGGGVSSAGTGGSTTLSDDSVTANGGSGSTVGGVDVQSQTATLTGDDVSDNEATAGAGLDLGHSSAYLIGDSITDDSTSAGVGGGLDTLSESVTAINDTFAVDAASSSTPSAGQGGAIYTHNGSLSLTYVTIAYSTASGEGSGLFNTGGTDTVADSLIDSNGCSGAVNDGGYNVATDDTCGVDSSDNPPSVIKTPAEVDLASNLATNGDVLALSLAVAADSAAVGEVPAADCQPTLNAPTSTTVITDERGQPRPGIPGAGCTAGAYELQGVAPTITSPASGSMTGGELSTVPLSATGTPTPTITVLGLPSWLGLVDNTLVGTPPVGSSGFIDLTVIATNAVTFTAQRFVLTIDETAQITSPSSATWLAGHASSLALTATGSPAPTLGLSGAPAWLKVTNDHLVGTPPAHGGGQYHVTITATNGVGAGATQAFTLTVDQSPSFTSAAHLTLTAGGHASHAVTTSGFPLATVSEVGALPPGVRFSAAHGTGSATIAGTPARSAVGHTYVVTLTATNHVSPNATQRLTITVRA